MKELCDPSTEEGRRRKEELREEDREEYFKLCLQDDRELSELITGTTVKDPYGLESKLGDMVRAHLKIHDKYTLGQYDGFASDFNQALIDALKHKTGIE